MERLCSAAALVTERLSGRRWLAQAVLGGGGGGVGGLLMVDWMVAVGPEAEDQRRRALVFILFCSVGYLTADLFSLTKSVISSLGRERRGWGGEEEGGVCHSEEELRGWESSSSSSRSQSPPHIIILVNCVFRALF